MGSCVTDVRMLTMFCVAMRRDVYEAVGDLDERFEAGLFEDDDYVMRVRQAGWRIVCAEGVYVHHFGEAAFGELGGTYAKLFERNRRLFETKWGVDWEPHRPRPDEEYQGVITHVREAVDRVVPPGSIVGVLSKGDEDLVHFDRVLGWHFPQTDDGTYAGSYPADSTDAVAQFEALCARGARFFVVPATGFWWLDYYAEFGRYLEEHCDVLSRDEQCLIFAGPRALSISPQRSTT
jgi:hypothetical protein